MLEKRLFTRHARAPLEARNEIPAAPELAGPMPRQSVAGKMRPASGGSGVDHPRGCRRPGPPGPEQPAAAVTPAPERVVLPHRARRVLRDGDAAPRSRADRLR